MLISEPLDHTMQLYLRFLKIFAAMTFSFNFSSLYRYTPSFSRLPTNCQHNLLEYRDPKNSVSLSLSLSEHEAQELQNSNTESLDGFAFFPANSWTREIWNLFHKSEISNIDNFKLIFFAFSNNKPHPFFLLDFLFIKYQKYPTKIPKSMKHSVMVYCCC